MSCCAGPKYVYEEELGHVESVDWDLVRCSSCGATSLAQWSEYAPDRTYYDPLTAEQAEQFRRTSGRERRILLKRWYADH
ncbi:MAG TPA: hypothetical protein VGX96_16150 [Candidatus Elarobacter sp.]|jgi:hypothetical protein|nr:hypothetical protein [Candidatus Elarobacter sp.]